MWQACGIGMEIFSFDIDCGYITEYNHLVLEWKTEIDLG